VREPRIKIPSEIGQADYHCWSKTVNGEKLFQDVEKEMLRRFMWQVADFCGVQILTYIILSNHFHFVIRLLQAALISDAELLRRYRVLHPRPTPRAAARLEVIEIELRNNTPSGQVWRQRQLALMGDVSQFMKLFKQRVSIWYNRTHNRFGPLWSDRFGSTLTGPGALDPMVTYTDLNAVRANMTGDPMEYRWCGYAEAVAGNVLAQQGLQTVFGTGNWTDTQAAYRERLFGVGGVPRDNAAHIPPEQVQKVFDEGGILPLPTLLRCKLKYFTHGAILGTRAFVLEHAPKFARHRKLRPLPKWSDEEFVVFRSVRSPAIG
jgi:REP element-mobilizing transposase RayT